MSKRERKVPVRRKRRSGRKIQTVYYFEDSVIKRNTAKYSHTAVTACVNHMQFNTYAATHAEVYDTEDGVVHAIVKASLVRGQHEINIIFKREVQEEHG